MSQTTDAGDTARQSIRLGFGAIMLVVMGLGLMLLDSITHAPSPVLIAHDLNDQGK